jgi:hypothetical protein
MFMIWHLRHQHDPMQRWLRGELEGVARELGPGTGGSPPA